MRTETRVVGMFGVQDCGNVSGPLGQGRRGEKGWSVEDEKWTGQAEGAGIGRSCLARSLVIWTRLSLFLQLTIRLRSLPRREQESKY